MPRKPSPGEGKRERMKPDRVWIEQEAILWRRIHDPRSYMMYERDKDGKIQVHKRSAIGTGKVKKRNRAGQPVSVSDEKKAAKSWKLYQAWLEH